MNPHVSVVQYRALARGLLSALALAAIPSPTFAKTILVFGPHPDDETLIAAGRVRAALTGGDQVKVVVVTNGDVGGTGSGIAREGESVAAAQTVGLTEQDVIFMGYGDQSMLPIYQMTNGQQIYTSQAGQTATYASRGLGGTDYHHYVYGVPGPYNRDTVVGDFKALLTNFRPDEVYTTSNFDTHPDHQATSLFLTEALVALNRAGAGLPTKVYHSIVWPPSVGHWPDVNGGGCSPTTPFTQPVWGGQVQLEWSRLARFPVPPEMQTTNLAANLKCAAISKYASQLTPWLSSWSRKDEFFWLNDFGINQAIIATVSVSTENSVGGQGGIKAIDGVIDGIPNDGTKEWVTLNELAGAWIQLSWSAPVTVAQVNLYDRPSLNDNILSGTLLFSNGSSIAVGALPPDGTVLPVTFSPRTVTWVRFSVGSAEGTAIGLSEIQVLGQPATSTANVPPNFLAGPNPTPDTINASQTSSVAVAANDLNGDAVQSQWAVDGGGTMQNSGATAVFSPPAVAAPTVFTIAAQLLDGRGGSTTNYTFVTVNPAVDSLVVNPTLLAAGDSATGTVSVANAAPAGGTLIPLSSSNTAAATVPASVTIPAGQAAASFTVATSLTLTAPATVTITATINGTAHTATITINPSLAPGNLARSATVSVSSENAGTGQLGIKAIDGVIDGYPGDYTKEWATLGQLAGAWIQLNWPTALTVQEVKLYDRPNLTDNVLAGTLVFSDGSRVSVGQLPNDGTGLAVSFPVRSVTWIRFNVDQAVGSNIGLAEFEVYAPASSFLTVSPTTVQSGGTAQGIVNLAAAAPAGGTQVALASSDPTSASVPPSVTVAAGASSATFPITAGAVATATAVTITASFASGPGTATLTVQPPPGVATLVLSPATVAGGTSSQGTVTLTGAAGPQGTLVQLATTDSSLTNVPASVTVPAGATSASFAIATASVTTPSTATLTATAGSSSASALLTVNPLALSGLALAPGTVAGGVSSQGTVTLNGVAPAGGATVMLASNNTSVTVPASVTVSAGTTSATFTAFTSPVSAAVAAVVTATYGASSFQATLQVTPPSLSALTLSPTSVAGGVSSTGTVTLTGPAPAAGFPLTLTSSNPAATVPASVTVPAGASTTTFSVATVAVSTTTVATIGASDGTITRTANLTVTAATLSSLSLSPTSVVGSRTSTGTVTLGSAAPASGVVVALRSNNAAATVPASVTVASGATTATFTISTTPVATNTSVTISATLGTTTRNATLTVQRPSLSSNAVSPTPMAGGGTATGTVTLSGPAPSAGITVTLASNNVAATVPASVVVPAGATTATYPVATTSVTASANVTVSASFAGTTRNATLSLRVLQPSSVTVNPATVVGTTPSTGTVTLNVAALAGGFTVALSSNRTAAATVPPSVVVPEGGRTAIFPITTFAVTANTSVTITASGGGVNRTATLTVTP
jgi:LmbE family N-acetylglucosaminyl deacetylase